MVKNSAKKRAVRGYKQENPGMRYTTALVEVGRPEPAADWAHGKAPWIRIGREPITCYLCGKTTMIRSSGDEKTDSGRVQVYCDNVRCEAREVELIVLRDGTSATLHRADVRVLDTVAPEAHHSAREPSEWEDWIPGATPWVRMAAEPVTCVFCGKDTALRSRADVAADCGRVQVYCDNPQCDVREVELIVMRDGTNKTMNRPDVAQLKDLDSPPAARASAGVPIIRPFAEWAEILENDDRVARRRGK